MLKGIVESLDSHIIKVIVEIGDTHLTKWIVGTETVEWGHSPDQG